MFVIHPNDNVEINLENGHKYARRAIKQGEEIIKYGFPIGIAKADIAENEHVHSHNVKTALGKSEEYEYIPFPLKESDVSSAPEIMAYVREDGNIGIRNDIWIINTVGCVNKTAEHIARRTGALSFPHPFGCSQLGGDHETTQKILKGLVCHPNCGGVLVLGLGCENNNIDEFKKVLGEYNPNRVKFLNAQDAEDDVSEGCKLVEELKKYASGFKRQKVSASKLKIGLKCGGSDGYSGITANPLVGKFSDLLCSFGGTSVLTEVPEMFGAERLLMSRCVSREIFDKNVALINDFKDYFIRHNQPIYENPSPGNKAGGITTLEEKSLGCVQKGGSFSVVDVLDYGDILTKPGLNLLNGPGNDMVAVTNLTAAGAHLILFTTGRGTPLGAPVPTIKISTNTPLFEKKANWIDFDAGRMLNGAPLDDLANELMKYVLEICEGKEAKNEIHDFREISIFKDGVTL